jgi:leucine efflux protein
MTHDLSFNISLLGIANYPAFCATVLVFLAIPGPGTFAVLTSTAKGGIKGGYASIIGLALGDWVFMLAAMLGLGAVLTSMPTLFKSIQYLGAAYLIWVGIQLLRVKSEGDGVSTLLPMDNGRFLRQSFLITLINPKAIVFYMAFFPLFITPAIHQGAVTFAAMGLTITALTVFYCSLLIFIGNAVATKLKRHRRARQAAHKVAGVGMIGFGVKMATQ